MDDYITVFDNMSEAAEKLFQAQCDKNSSTELIKELTDKHQKCMEDFNKITGGPI